MKPNDRLRALRILKRVFVDKVPLSHAFNEEETVSPFVKALSFGLCRYYFALERIARTFLDKKPKEQDIWLLILLGLYQLHYLSKPAYATVQETVAQVDFLNKRWAKGLVNAILRRYCREQQNLKSLPPEANHPLWLVEILKKDWPTQWEAILKANDEHPPFTLRVNQQKSTLNAYLGLLKDQGLKAKSLEHAPMGIILEAPCEVLQLPRFQEGYVSVQDAASQYAAELLQLTPGLRLLDACVAPGGKLCHILEKEPQLGFCLGLDKDKKRLLRVHENLNRLDLKATLLEADASLPNAWWDGLSFDRILLDAPCSALGVIRRHPDIKILRTKEEVEASVLSQKTILEALWPLLKEGGLLLYATCSVLKQENSEQIESFILKHADCTLLPLDKPWGIDTGFGRQILPGMSDGDGFFYSLLQKKSPRA